MRAVIVGCGHVRHFTRARLAEHRHQGLELIAVLAGKPCWQVDGRVQEVPRGWVHFNLAWQSHGTAGPLESAREVRWVIIALDRAYGHRPESFGFHPDLHIPVGAARRLAQRLLSAQRHACPASPQLFWLLEQVVTEQRHRRRGWRALVARYAGAAIYELDRCLDAPMTADGGDDSTRRVQQFLASLAPRCPEPWTLETMAAHCRLGRTRFAAICRAIAGESPVAVLRRRRIEMAQDMLRDSHRSITDIALSCGFASSQYFARHFRRLTGTSARHFRASSQRPGGTP